MPSASLAHTEWYRRLFAGNIQIDLQDLLLYGLILLGSLARVITPFQHNPLQHIWSDPGRWWGYAQSGVDAPPLALMDPMFYQAWMSFIAKLTLDIPELTALYAALLSVLTPWLWYRFMREVLPHKRQALLGWGLLAILPSWIGIYSYFMTETLLLPLLGLALWLSWRSLRKRTTGSLVLAAFVWTIAGLTRGAAAPIAVAVMPFIWWRQEHRIQSAVVCTLVVFTLLGLSGYRIYVKSGVFAPLGIPMMNTIYAQSGAKEVKITLESQQKNIGFVYGFASPSMGIAPFEPFSDWRTSREGTVEIKIELDRAAESWAEAKQLLKDHPTPPASTLITENLIFLFFGPSWPDTNPAYWFDQLSTWMRFIWAPLFVLAVAWLSWRIVQGERRHAPPVLAAMLLWLVIQGMSLVVPNEGRYRKPIEGLIVVALMMSAASMRSRVDDGLQHSQVSAKIEPA